MKKAAAFLVLFTPLLQGCQSSAPTHAITMQTNLQDRTPGQKHNAKLAARALNGTKVPAKSEFSFIKTVGGWTRDRGYVKAPVSFSGQLIPSYGGGVCQTSTTLYIAALKAGMEIRERHPHAFAPTYVAPGLDAAVAYQSADFRFYNPYPFPVEIQASADGRSLRVSLVAERAFQERSLENIILNAQRPAVRRTGPADGWARVRNGGKAGYEVQVWRSSKGQRELISHDTYPPMDRIIERSATARNEP